MEGFALEKILTISARDYCEMYGKKLDQYIAVGLCSYSYTRMNGFQGVIPEGAEVVIAVDNSNKSFIVDVILRVYSLFRNKSFRQRLKSYYKEMRYQNNDENVLIIKPSVKLPISIVDNNHDDIIKTIQIGYNDVLNKTTLIQKLLSN